ncbi:MAG: Gfo/Idh/MocA family oxidoreductase [bacterium]|nr:Gfo/Idh/MocA family oxidoreductase [bacterium]
MTRRFIFVKSCAKMWSGFRGDRINRGGTGGRGRAHVGYYSELDEECQVAAVCDVNQAARERGQAQVRKLKDFTPKSFVDMREMYEDKDVDAVSIATPNHWHALAAIWAVQAGKDVYVEKPASHNVFEGRQMVKAARKYNRMVQVGSQSRSIAHKIWAMKLLKDGEIGTVYMSRGLCFRRRKSIGHTPDEPAPPGVDWDKFLGPAQMKPYSKNKFAYNWHWFFDTGNGDIGNQGVHEMDICLWGLGRTGWPKAVSSIGGKYIWKDDQETPNTEQAAFDFGDSEMTFDVRNLSSPPEGSAPIVGSNYVGNIFFGTEGYLVVDSVGFQVYKGDQREKTMDEKAMEKQIWSVLPHIKNFFAAIRKRDHRMLNAEVEIGALAAAYCHFANISYQVGRRLSVNQTLQRFEGDQEANEKLTRDYRAPYVVPEQV